MPLNAVVEEASARSGRTVYSDNHLNEDDCPIASADDEDLGDHAAAPMVQPTTIAVPELTHPGESATNGLAERSIRTVEEHVRTMLTALEAHVKVSIPTNHAIISWIVEHSTFSMNNYLLGRSDKKTPILSSTLQRFTSQIG